MHVISPPVRTGASAPVHTTVDNPALVRVTTYVTVAPLLTVTGVHESRWSDRTMVWDTTGATEGEKVAPPNCRGADVSDAL